MSGIHDGIQELYSLEEIAERKGFLQSRSQGIKLFVTMLYLFSVLSLGRYELGKLLSFACYPLLLIPLLDIPYSLIFRRTAVALPFVLFAGISNLIFDRTVLFQMGGVPISGGFLSFLVLLLRSFLSVSAVLIFVAATPMFQITALLRRLHIPEILVMLFEMTYRYIAVLSEEAGNMLTAFRLRSSGRKWPSMKEFSVFIAQLLLRSQSRAERVYQAMKCRLYPSEMAFYSFSTNKNRKIDFLFLFLCSGCILLLRFTDLTSFLGEMLI